MESAATAAVERRLVERTKRAIGGNICGETGKDVSEKYGRILQRVIKDIWNLREVCHLYRDLAVLQSRVPHIL